MSDIITYVLRMPFELISQNLRKLSMGSDAGNVVAWIFFVLIGLVPIAILAIKCARHHVKLEDGMLIIISALIYQVLYMLINPGLYFQMIQDVRMYEVQSLGACIVAYSAIAVYLIMKLIRFIYDDNKKALKRSLAILVCVLSIFVFCEMIVDSYESIKGIKILFTDDADILIKLGVTVLDIADNVVYGITFIAVFIYAYRFLKEFIDGGFTEDLVVRAKTLQRASVIFIVGNILVNMCYNVVQLLAGRYLNDTSVVVMIPTFEIICLVFVVLITKLIADNKKLKEENELFV
ncbi:MAG: hypothetical protein IJB96_05915 [Lachnospira sp.]|nr:hypothetical protein [Lachnospira sp.]